MAKSVPCIAILDCPNIHYGLFIVIRHKKKTTQKRWYIRNCITSFFFYSIMHDSSRSEARGAKRRAARFIISSRAKRAGIIRGSQGHRVWLVSASTSSRVVTSKHLWVSRQPIAIDDKALGFIFSSVNYNNAYGRWITTQHLRQIKENSKLNNGGFNKWLEILGGKDLQTKLRKSKNVD